VAPLIFYFEKVLANSQGRARKILALHNDHGTVPENQERAFKEYLSNNTPKLSAFMVRSMFSKLFVQPVQL
jgi:hypothetical protein